MSLRRSPRRSRQGERIAGYILSAVRGAYRAPRTTRTPFPLSSHDSAIRINRVTISEFFNLNARAVYDQSALRLVQQFHQTPLLLIAPRRPNHDLARSLCQSGYPSSFEDPCLRASSTPESRCRQHRSPPHLVIASSELGLRFETKRISSLRRYRPQSEESIPNGTVESALSRYRER